MEVMDIYQNIKDGKYKNNVAIGGKCHKPTELHQLEKKPAGELTDAEFAKLKELRHRFDLDREQYRTDSAKYRAEEDRLNALFEADCAEDQGLTNHPKRGKLWGKAWEHGHAGGYGDIYSYYCDLAELIRD
jgi:hypothetical protein